MQAHHPRPNTDISGPAKRRKTYTIRKQRESWTDQEHQKFIEALHRFGRDWKQIEAFVGTKTLIQIRSHAQKHFEKLERQGESSAIPPPKPKRRQDGNSTTPLPPITSHPPPIIPAPQNSSSETLTIPWITTPDALSERPYLNSPDAFAEWMKSNGFLPEHPPPGITTNQMLEMERQNRQVIQQAVEQVRSLPQETANTRNVEEDSQQPSWTNMYSYIGSLFDSGVVYHDPSRIANLQLSEKQILQLLMHNLLSNLSDTQLSDQSRALLQQYEQQIRIHQSTPGGGTVSEETIIGIQPDGNPNSKKRKNKPVKSVKTSKKKRKQSPPTSEESVDDDYNDVPIETPVQTLPPPSTPFPDIM